MHHRREGDGRRRIQPEARAHGRGRKVVRPDVAGRRGKRRRERPRGADDDRRARREVDPERGGGGEVEAGVEQPGHDAERTGRDDHAPAGIQRAGQQVAPERHRALRGGRPAKRMPAPPSRRPSDREDQPTHDPDRDGHCRNIDHEDRNRREDRGDEHQHGERDEVDQPLREHRAQDGAEGTVGGAGDHAGSRRLAEARGKCGVPEVPDQERPEDEPERELLAPRRRVRAAGASARLARPSGRPGSRSTSRRGSGRACRMTANVRDGSTATIRSAIATQLETIPSTARPRKRGPRVELPVVTGRARRRRGSASPGATTPAGTRGTPGRARGASAGGSSWSTAGTASGPRSIAARQARLPQRGFVP